MQFLTLGPVNVVLYGKRDFVDVIKFRLLNWGHYPALLKRASNIILIRDIFIKKKAQRELTTEERKCDMPTEVGGEKAIWYDEGVTSQRR